MADPETTALDRAVDELAAAADQWRQLSLVAKRDLLRESAGARSHPLQLTVTDGWGKAATTTRQMTVA